MASEEDLAESGTSSPATSTSQVSRAARPGASENLRCPICRAAMNDRACGSWRRHPFCFYCMVEWFHTRVGSLICQSPSPHAFHMVGDSSYEVDSIGVSISPVSHTQEEQAGPHSAETRQHQCSGSQHCNSYNRSCGGSRGGSRGRAQEKGRSRYSRRHHGGRARVQQVQSYNHSSSSRRRQSRAQNAARNTGRAPRTKRHIRAISRKRKDRQEENQVSFRVQRTIRSRSRQRPRSSDSQTLREYLREMERDEGQALRDVWYIRASSRRGRRQQQGRRASYREPQVTGSRNTGRLRSTLPMKKNPRRMECNESQPLRIEQGIHASPRRNRRLQQGRQVSFVEPQVTRSQSRGRSRSTQYKTLRENLQRMELDRVQVLRPEQDIPTSSGWSESHQRGSQISFTEPQLEKN